MSKPKIFDDTTQINDAIFTFLFKIIIILITLK